MSSPTVSDSENQIVPDEVIPHKHLPPLHYREMPVAIPWRKMIGPSILLAGLQSRIRRVHPLALHHI
ncbi:MAG: hypothetical protein R3C11_25680 [Planctomycetaceae bacterium]